MRSTRLNSKGRVAFLGRWRNNFHLHEVSTLPRKLSTWAPHIDIDSNIPSQQMQLILTDLQALSYRMHDLLNTRDKHQAEFLLKELLEKGDKHQTEFLMQELLEDILTWRLRVQDIFRRLSVEPAVRTHKDFKTRFAEIMGNLDERMRETLNKASSGKFNDHNAENFFQLLGTFQGMSETLARCIESVSVIDVPRWREEKFL